MDQCGFVRFVGSGGSGQLRTSMQLVMNAAHSANADPANDEDRQAWQAPRPHVVQGVKSPFSEAAHVS